MSIHKLTAGSGYNYLIRQVAALDATERGRVTLASYYTERGETPGVWLGSGLVGVAGLSAGDSVTAEQMQALFGYGLHPLAMQQHAAMSRSGLTDPDGAAVGRLGLPFKVYEPDVSAFRLAVAERLAAWNAAAGLPGDWPVPADERARIRSEVGREFFRSKHGRDPVDARELAGEIARASRPRTTAVAGFDLTFSPVKSVSALWAVAAPSVAATIERAHQAAVADALLFIERHALFTRTGANGVRQVDVHGLVATAFTHRDSRAGDPDLHTHVAVANKVQTLDGRWLSIDGRVLFKATVAASETYNTALEQHLRNTLGVQFTERPNPDPRLRPVREVVSVEPALNQRWSARRAMIDSRRGELAADFQRQHGRPPTSVEVIRLAQQANLETRDAKHEPRTLAEQRTTWRAQAADVLGGVDAIQVMVHTALAPDAQAPSVADADWVTEAADRVVAALEGHRATWQVWHVRAEVERQVRPLDLPSDRTTALTALLIDTVLQDRSVCLAQPFDGVVEPALLRRVDGASVYTVAGADLFTSARVLEAETRLVTTAGSLDGCRVDAAVVDRAVAGAVEDGVVLNDGQAHLVKAMATSGARLQLAIAPAGAGKTTALRVLAQAWTAGGGTLLGLAPSAAAAAALREQITAGGSAGVVTDTMAKLTWSLDHDDLPGWAEAVGPSTLVVVDEAGMADTLSLDAVVAFVVARGGSVRLVGDDQQLAAVGGGGVLRDIEAAHGAVRLTELLRFADPAEAAATLALRDGRPDALGFYLDQNRVHVGDLTTITEEVFAAWRSDRDRGLDAIMLAPTRALTAELNARARNDRLNTTNPAAPALQQLAGRRPAGPRSVVLADGNEASVGDVVITRANNRRLRTSGTDWVKNGDRWTILDLSAGGGVRVRHMRSGRTVTLPGDYVTASVELGYATTVHAAQGVSVDTMHGLATGEESRQQLYTMMTRGRLSNHVYLQVVGDGDPHSIIRPDVVRPVTPTDLLEQILATDGAPKSATTLQKDQNEPTTRLREGVPRYVDALYVAAEDITPPDTLNALEAAAERHVPGVTAGPAWPTLRAHLLLLATDGSDPASHLQAAAAQRELASAGDPAAVLDWRLDSTGLRNAGQGPLPWLPGIPDSLAAHPRWGGYLTQRAALVTQLAGQVSKAAGDTQSGWQPPGQTCPAEVMQNVAVWRAAMRVDPADRRPTGPVQLGQAARTWQRHLNQTASSGLAPALQEWRTALQQAGPAVLADTFAPVLADHLATLTRSGVDARQLLYDAITSGPVPNDHAAAALWWRISRAMTNMPSPATSRSEDHDSGWTRQLPDLVGPEQADELQSSVWWPPLTSLIDRALEQGWPLEALFSHPTIDRPLGDAGCERLVWRISILLDARPTDGPHDEFDDTEPDDLGQATGSGHVVGWGAGGPDLNISPTDPGTGTVTSEDERWVDGQLAIAARLRNSLGPLEQTDTDVDRMFVRAMAWQECAVPRDRLVQVNQMAATYFEQQFQHSWARDYLNDRFGHDLSHNQYVRPGYAPAGWTHLVTHLRQQGVSDQEMLTAGVAAVASTGRLIDRFRDRVILPIHHDGLILGFVGRRHPHQSDDDHTGPKYLNTADTPLFHKGAQLYCPNEQHLLAGAVPVLVEGPLDATAVTVATGGRYIGVAPLGTSMTDEQAAQIGALGIDPVIATDGDLAGRVAAERQFWLLAPHGLAPVYAALPQGSDPADLLARHGPEALSALLTRSRSLAEYLIDERLGHLPPDAARLEALKVVAAQPSAQWNAGLDHVADGLQLPPSSLRHDLLELAQQWNTDPRGAAQTSLQHVSAVKKRLTESEDPCEAPSLAVPDNPGTQVSSQGRLAASDTPRANRLRSPRNASTQPNLESAEHRQLVVNKGGPRVPDRSSGRHHPGGR